MKGFFPLFFTIVWEALKLLVYSSSFLTKKYILPFFTYFLKKRILNFFVLVIVNKMGVSAPFVLRLVTSDFDVFGNDDSEHNRKCTLASYRGKVLRKYTNYQGQVYGMFFFYFYMNFFLVELVLEEGFYKFFSALGVDMKVLADSGEGAKTFDELAQIVEQDRGFGTLKLVFRTTVAYELVSQRVRDLERTIEVVPNRPDTIRLLSENPSHEVLTANCIGYTPYYPPDDAVQLFVGGPKYANDYQTAQTKHVSSLKDLRNKFCKF